MMKDCILSFLLLVASGMQLKAQSDPIAIRKDKGNHWYASMVLQQKQEVRVMLESGIPFPILDSTFVFNNLEKLGFKPLASSISMNLNGNRLRCFYEINDPVYLNNHYYKGKTLVADLSPKGIEMMYPIQTFVNGADSGSCILEMDIQKQSLRFLTRKELQAQKEGYRLFKMDKIAPGNLYVITSSLSIQDTTGRTSSLEGRFLLDLGNSLFLFLLEKNPKTSEFLKTSVVQPQPGYSPDGKPSPLQVMVIPEGRFGKEIYFSNVLVGVTPLLRMNCEGILGMKFFEQFPVIFDFGSQRFYLKKEADKSLQTCKE